MPRRSKYNAVRTKGFASKREAQRFDELRLLEKAGAISDLQCQVAYKVAINGRHCFTYYADFRYFDGQEHRVEDVKGYKTAMYRLKKKVIEAYHGITIEET